MGIGPTEADPQRTKRSAINLHSSTVQVYNADPTDMDFILEEKLDKTDLIAPENEDYSLSLTQKLNESKSLLISSFGLDLINGGNKKDYELNLRQLMHSIEGGNCGFYSLDGKAIVENGHGRWLYKS